MSERGFTLIEILVAITITGIIVGVIFSFFDQSFSIWHRASIHSSWQQQWRILENELKGDLHSVFVSPLYQHNLFRGTSTQLQWKIIKDDKIRRVDYSFSSSNNKLIRKVINPKTEKVLEEIEFFSDLELTEFKFTFNHEKLGYWKDNWNYQQTNYLPAVIKVEVKAKAVQLPPLVIENFVGRRYGGR